MADAPFGFAPAPAGADPTDYSQFIRPGMVPWGSWTVQQAPTPGEYALGQAGKAWSDVKRALLPSFMQEPSDQERQAARAAQNKQLAQTGYAPFLPWEHGGNPLTNAVELGAMLPFGAMGAGAKAAVAGAGKVLPAMAGMVPKAGANIGRMAEENAAVGLYDFAKSEHPYHDWWKKGRPAVKNDESGEVLIGDRGDLHQHILDKQFGEGIEPLWHGWTRGVWHPELRDFKTTEETGLHGTDLMSKLQRMRRYGD